MSAYNKLFAKISQFIYCDMFILPLLVSSDDSVNSIYNLHLPLDFTVRSLLSFPFLILSIPSQRLAYPYPNHSTLGLSLFPMNKSTLFVVVLDTVEVDSLPNMYPPNGSHRPFSREPLCFI